MKGTLAEKRTDSADLMSSRRSRRTGRPRYTPLGPLGPNPLKAVPLKAANESGPPPLASSFLLGNMKADFVSNHLGPVAEFFVIIHPMSLKDVLEKFEIEVIRNVLAREKGNVKKAARYLGTKYTTLHSKVKKYAIEPVRFETPGQ